MPLRLNTPCRAGVFIFLLLVAALDALAQRPAAVTNAPVTNLWQMVELLNRDERAVRDVRVEATVCAVSDPSIGVLVLQDATDTALVEFGGGLPEISPGERIRIDNKSCLLRRRGSGVQITAAPVVDNDKVHGRITAVGGLSLRAGRHPLALEWFSQFQEGYLDVTWQLSNTNFPARAVSGAEVSHVAFNPARAEKQYQPGLVAECYEGNWENVPDFDLLTPAKSGVTTNFDLDFRTRDQLTAMRFTGFFDAPTNGYYSFNVRSAAGSLLFIGNPMVRIERLETIGVPDATPVVIGEIVKDSNLQRWVSAEGRVGAVSTVGKGLELELFAEQNLLHVHIADARGCDANTLLNTRVRVTGVGSGVFDLSGGLVLGKLAVASAKNLQVLEAVSSALPSAPALVKVNQVQTLPLADAKSGVPVHARGVVTSMGGPYDFWISVQDETRGIFVDFHNASNSVPVCGDYYEIIGHSGAGDFAPVIIADQLVRLGKGDLPSPAHPTWSALNNGSMDVQWMEFEGLVTAVRSNTLSMLLPDGEVEVQVEGQAMSRLPAFEKNVVRIRGVLFAVWNATREVRVGRILVRNADIAVEIPAPADPFDAVVKTPRELLLFDAQATAFRRVKVRGQIVHAGADQIYLMQDGAGLRILPADKTDVRPGDLVEAVGYPDIGGTTLLLRETHLRKTGAGALPPPRTLTELELTREGLDSTRVQVEGKLLGSHLERGAPVLEMQSGSHLYLARLPVDSSAQFSLRYGSRLALTGVYAGQGRNQRSSAEAGSFELLINSPADIAVLSQPPWWTLQRLLILVGVLMVVLIFTAVWISQLRRLVEQRTAQLQRETRERERVERQHALEAERSRIARDLHDDLGSSLTEIGVLANTGQRAQGEDKGGHANLFHSIAGKARGLIAALDVIVWAVDPEDNSLQSLADYLSGYAGEYLESSGIACRFKMPMTFPAVTLDGRVRHDLLMAVKETLNNIVRHANATEVEFRMSAAGGVLDIAIADNGKGFQGAVERDGHGLKNLSARLNKLGGSCVVESQVGGGTTVKINLPLPAAGASLPDPEKN
jgi:signal transduction histidine kinase